MESLERKSISHVVILVFIALFFVLCIAPCVTVYSEERFPLNYEIPSEFEDQYIELLTDDGSYEVKAGDSLWQISENVWGDGSFYPLLFECNTELAQNQGFIYPGMVLEIGRKAYIRKQTGSMGVKSLGQYYVDVPYGWHFGILEAGDAFANFALYDSTIDSVMCLFRDKEQAAVKSMEDWENFQNSVKDYIGKNYAEVVSNLSFERYQSQKGEELYLYSFEYFIDLSNYGYSKSFMKVYICQGIKQTEHLQAEFTGFCLDEDIRDIVRYIASSFEELPTQDGKVVSVNDTNITILPSIEWELSGIHNPFPWIEAYFHGILCEVTDTALKEKTTEDKLLDYMHDSPFN